MLLLHLNNLSRLPVLRKLYNNLTVAYSKLAGVTTTGFFNSSPNLLYTPRLDKLNFFATFSRKLLQKCAGYYPEMALSAQPSSGTSIQLPA